MSRYQSVATLVGYHKPAWYRLATFKPRRFRACVEKNSNPLDVNQWSLLELAHCLGSNRKISHMFRLELIHFGGRGLKQTSQAVLE